MSHSIMCLSNGLLEYMIGHFLVLRHQLFRLTLVCRRFHRIVEPILYRRAIPMRLDSKSERPFMFTCTQRLLDTYKRLEGTGIETKLRYIGSLYIDFVSTEYDVRLEAFLAKCVNVQDLHINAFGLSDIKARSFGHLVAGRMPRLESVFINFNIQLLSAKGQSSIIQSVLNGLSSVTPLRTLGFDYCARLAAHRGLFKTEFTWGQFKRLTVRTLELPGPFASFARNAVFSMLKELIILDCKPPITSLLLNRRQMPVLETLQVGCLDLRSIEALKNMRLYRLRFKELREWPNEWRGELPYISVLELSQMDITTIAVGLERLEHAHSVTTSLRTIVIREAIVHRNAFHSRSPLTWGTAITYQLKCIKASYDTFTGMGVALRAGNLDRYFVQLEKLTAEEDRE